ncbi:unnamed protein product [Thlaspi arvense]|uniref:Putative gamma-glutamylcyclotransferase n=1 Tax=Thlaspi arvense TaxID=13288 RepID=A0AAU9RNS2_THLAR|nr:unnamed protein product [Thlaspi arvense]
MTGRKMSSSDAPPSHNVFVYGSILEPAVAAVILDRSADTVPALLHGYHRYKLKDRSYPCIVPFESGKVNGLVITGVTDAELNNFDVIEGIYYERVTVEVVRTDNSEKMKVETYVWINKDDPTMYGEWDFEEWRVIHADKFVETFKNVLEWNKNPNGMRREDVAQSFDLDSNPDTLQHNTILSGHSKNDDVHMLKIKKKKKKIQCHYQNKEDGFKESRLRYSCEIINRALLLSTNSSLSPQFQRKTMTTSDQSPSHNVFVYGSFQEPAVVGLILECTPVIIPAKLHGFHLYRLKGRLHPCIAPSENGVINGKILTGLTDAQLENLDMIEGDEYVRTTVEVVLTDTSEKMQVEAFVWANKDDPDMYGEWDFEEWKRLHMEKFIEASKQFIEWKKNPNGRTREEFAKFVNEDPPAA